MNFRLMIDNDGIKPSLSCYLLRSSFAKTLLFPDPVQLSTARQSTMNTKIDLRAVGLPQRRRTRSVIARPPKNCLFCKYSDCNGLSSSGYGWLLLPTRLLYYWICSLNGIGKRQVEVRGTEVEFL